MALTENIIASDMNMCQKRRSRNVKEKICRYERKCWRQEGGRGGWFAVGPRANLCGVVKFANVVVTVR